MNNLNYDMAQNYKPKYHYVLEKDGEEFEFESYAEMVYEVLNWDDVLAMVYEFETNLDTKFPVDSEEERDTWIYDTMDEILDAAGYCVNKVLR